MRITDEVVKEHHLYKALEESIEEASNYISYLSSSNEWLATEMKYLQDFISYKKLDDEYLYFRDHAHLQEEIDLPFPPYVL